ncbi:ABC transporter permease [Brachybacterium sp. AOP43-C2-M15]|uniref:ABC transporter permease n=1 Tax=Brachybacterium sp. AOP43-C2-M15 TaxID=3457661 RepID=UPI0040335A69
MSAGESTTNAESTAGARAEPGEPPGRTGTVTTAAAVRRHRRQTAMYALSRIVRALFTIFVVASGTFFLVRLLPGSPVDVYINEQISTYGMSYEQAAAQAAGLFSFDPNAPLMVQYADYMIALVQGDFGNSITAPGTPVITMIGQYLPWTLFSVGLALVLSFVLGVGLGMVMAYRRGTWFDHLATGFGSVTQSIPSFLMAIMIIVFFGVQLGWLPLAAMRGAYTPGVTIGFNAEFIGDALFHAALPIICYVLTSLGGWMLVMKSSTVQVLGDDYVQVARARGLKDSRIQFQYVGRNAMLPLFTSFMLSIGFVVGGSILVETITRYPGIGMLLYSSISSRDYTTIQGVLLLTTIAVVIANLLADFLYSTIDPRVRLTGKDG